MKQSVKIFFKDFEKRLRIAFIVKNARAYESKQRNILEITIKDLDLQGETKTNLISLFDSLTREKFDNRKQAKTSFKPSGIIEFQLQLKNKYD